MYKGRFAPSPTGPLHFGSLVAALCSFFRARQNDGHWLLRIEDIDPPREPIGAREAILATLMCHGLQWDELSSQSQNNSYYEDAITRLSERGLVYPCACSRKRIRESGAREMTEGLGPVYPGFCLENPPSHSSGCGLRLRTNGAVVAFDDLVQGQVQQDLAVESGDFLLKRADGLYSYSLAVAVDDAREGITEVIRGADLLAQTPRQIYVMQQLGYRPPVYGHIPIATNHLGQKWSKQSGAPSLDNSKATANLVDAMEFLGLPTASYMKSKTVDRLLAWGTAEFRLERLNKIKAKVMHLPV